MTVSPDKRRKLTDEQREEIRRRRGAGEDAAALAAEYGIVPRTVYQIADPDFPAKHRFAAAVSAARCRKRRRIAQQAAE